MRKTSSGFSLVILLITLVVLAGVGFAGWYVWKQNHTENKNTTSSSASTQTSSSSKQDSTTSKQKYLVITEWGVKIPLSSEISGAYYKLEVQDNAEYARIYDAGFDNLKNSDGVSCVDSPFEIYVIGRTTPAKVAAASSSTEPEFKKYPFTNDYLFNGLGAHQSAPDCLFLNDQTQDTTISNAENQKERAFDAAFKELAAE